MDFLCHSPFGRKVDSYVGVMDYKKPSQPHSQSTQTRLYLFVCKVNLKQEQHSETLQE